MTARLFPFGHAAHPHWRAAAALALAQVRGQMATPEYASAPALGLLYITDHYAEVARELLEFMVEQLPEVKAWSGTVGVGVAANNAEYIDEPALSVMLCDVAPEQWRIFSGVAPMPRADQGDFAVRAALVHADESTPDLAEVLQEIAERTSAGFVFGGITASRGPRAQFARDLLREATRPADESGGVFQGGLSGVAFGPGVQWVSRVTQGCKPISPWAVVTAAQDNLLLELDGVPALDVLLETLDVTLEGDTQPAIQAVNSTMAGVLDVGASQPHTTGHIGANTRALHIVGLDATRRGVALAEQVQPGTWMTFCQRHQSAARADLMRICAEIREEVEPDEDVLPAHGSTTLDSTAVYGRMQAPRRILGAVYISCSDRSGHFFGGTSAELQIVRRALGDVPLVGFFAHGEIAEHRLYGYTGVLTVFVE